MACTGFDSISGFSDLVIWPTTCNYYFALIFLSAIWIILAWTMFKAQKDSVTGEGDMISSLGISSLVITVISSTGTLVRNSQDIPFVQIDILLIILAIAIPLIGIWLFKNN